MRLFPRLLLNHLAVIALMAVVLIVAAELAAHPFIQHHVEEMVQLLGSSGTGMRTDLSSGMRATLTRALLTAMSDRLEVIDPGIELVIKASDAAMANMA